MFVVDDDISVRESLELLIETEGLLPETFASAQEFLARPPSRVPSCLILDVALPDLNGLDLQKRIAGDRADMPIIFITGHGDVPMTVRAMKAGAVEFLTKPFSDDVLLERRPAGHRVQPCRPPPPGRTSGPARLSRPAHQSRTRGHDAGRIRSSQ